MSGNRKGITYIISNIDKALAFEWIAAYIRKDVFELSFILLNPGDSFLEDFLKENNILVHRIVYRGKKDLAKALFILLKILVRERTQIIHTHLFDASLIGLFAAKLAGVSKRVFTRHHGNQHHAYFPKAVLYDRLINTLATRIVAPSESVKKILVEQETVAPSKISVINHGFDLSYFSQANEEVSQTLRQKYNPDGKHPVIGVISRYTELKGLQYIIPAFKKIVALYPNALLILANAGGDYKVQIKELLSDLDDGNYLEIPFEPNISSLYQIFDIFIHASVEPSSEAFGQTYVEALAAGVPSIFTLSGVASEFIVDRKNALVVPFRDSDAIFDAIKELLVNDSLRSLLIETGKQDVYRKFALSTMIRRLEDLYES